MTTPALGVWIGSLRLKNPFLAYFVLITSTLLGEALIYFLGQRCFGRFIQNSVRQSQVVQLLAKESHERPFRTALLTRFLLIPLGVKAYLLAFLGNRPESFFASGFVVHSVNIFKSCVVASQTLEIGEIIDDAC